MTYALTLSSCDMQYPTPSDDDCAHPRLAQALENVFNLDPNEEARVIRGSGDCDLEVWHELGAHPSINFKVTKGRNELFTLAVNDLYEVDALRRFCEMVIDHNQQTGDPDSPVR